MAPTEPRSGTRRGSLAAAAAIAAAAAVACVGPIEPRLTLWDATLAAADPEHPALIGSLGAVADERVRRTEASIAVQNAPPGATLPWRIRAGTCGGTGGILGAVAAYPDLVTDEVGTAESLAAIGQALRGGESYSVEVWDAEETQLVGCGPLVQR